MSKRKYTCLKNDKVYTRTRNGRPLQRNSKGTVILHASVCWNCRTQECFWNRVPKEAV